MATMPIARVRRYVATGMSVALLAGATGLLLGTALAQSPGEVYVAVPPCRIVDTRAAALGALAANTTRTFHVVGASSDFAAQGGRAGGCGIPGYVLAQPQAGAVMFNFVAVRPEGAGDLRAWASDQPMPAASVLNYAALLNLANGIAIPVRQDVEGGDLSLRADVATTHVVVDVVGYFQPHADRDTLGSLACGLDQLAKWTGTAWACADDADTDSGGTVTAVTAGTGLSGGTITTSGTLAVAFSGTGAASAAARADHNHDATYLRLGQAAGGSLSGVYPSPAIATGAVGSTHIADAAVTPAKVSAAGSTGGQALVSTGAGVAWGTPATPPRKYYKTLGRGTGSQALAACASGYHMAALMEIFNTSVLQYDTALGGTTADSGSGPPIGYAWIRTGNASATNSLAGVANCAAWTSAVSTHYGTMASVLNGTWDSTPVTMIAPWRSLVTTCDQAEAVWCVQN